MYLMGRGGQSPSVTFAYWPKKILDTPLVVNQVYLSLSTSDEVEDVWIIASAPPYFSLTSAKHRYLYCVPRGLPITAARGSVPLRAT